MIRDNNDSFNEELISEWICEVIHREVSKPDDEADLELIDECEKTLSCLNDGSGLSEEELKKRLEKIMNKSDDRAASVHKLRTKSIRRVALAVACLVVVMIVGMITAYAFVPSAKNYVQEVMAGKIGHHTDMDGVTFIYNGNVTDYSTVDELLHSTELQEMNVILPNGLPSEMALSKLEIVKNERASKITVFFSDTSISMAIKVGSVIDINEVITRSEETVYNGITSYISEVNGVYSSITVYGSNVYYITSSSKDKIKTILSCMKPED